MRLVDEQHHGLEKWVVLFEQLAGRNDLVVAWPQGHPQRLKYPVLADAMSAAQHQHMVDLDAGILPAMRTPVDDLFGFAGIEQLDMIDPGCGLRGISADRRR